MNAFLQEGWNLLPRVALGKMDLLEDLVGANPLSQYACASNSEQVYDLSWKLRL